MQYMALPNLLFSCCVKLLNLEKIDKKTTARTRSFFSPKPKTKVESAKSPDSGEKRKKAAISEDDSPLKNLTNLDDSPVKAPSRKRARILDSDEEDDKIVEKAGDKATDGGDSDKTKGTAQRLEKVSEEKGSIKDDKNSQDSGISISSEREGIFTPVKSPYPARKTARKSMGGSAKKVAFQKIEEKMEEETEEVKEEQKIKTETIKEESPEKADMAAGETVKQEAMEAETDVKDAESVEEEQNKDSEKDKETKKQSPLSKNGKEKKKSTPKSVKKEKKTAVKSGKEVKVKGEKKSADDEGKSDCEKDAEVKSEVNAEKEVKEIKKKNDTQQKPKSGVNPFAAMMGKPKDEKKEEYTPSKSKYHPIDDACWKHKDKLVQLGLVYPNTQSQE